MSGPEQDSPIPDVPALYFNGFQLGLSNADVNAILMHSNVPIATMSMSYTTAKTLSLALTDMIATLERVTGHEIMTNQKVAEGLETLSNQGTSDGNVH